MKNDKIIVTKIYPIINSLIAKYSNQYKSCVGRFISKRSKELYDIAPCDRIFFGQEDIDEFYKSIGLMESDITEHLRDTYYYGVANFNPRAAKDEFTIANLMIIRYFFLKGMKKELELAMIYLAFSGKFYPSIHYGSFPKVQPSEYRHIMEYVVNEMLTQKFDLKVQGSVFGAIRSICNTWINTYEKKIKECDDEDVVYIIQQLHNRIKSFIINIATLYYQAYENKSQYMTYDSDNLDENNYHLADSDSLKAERIIEKSMQFINSSDVDYRLCKMASDSNVKTEEVKSIIQTILNDKDTILEVKEFISISVYSYFQQSKTKDVSDIDFITFSISPKPNTKDPHIIKQKEIVEKWLNENSPAYRKRKSRTATKLSYHKSVFTYFTLVIHEANK